MHPTRLTTGIQSEGSVSEEAPDLQTGYAGTPDA